MGLDLNAVGRPPSAPRPSRRRGGPLVGFRAPSLVRRAGVHAAQGVSAPDLCVSGCSKGSGHRASSEVPSLSRPGRHPAQGPWAPRAAPEDGRAACAHHDGLQAGGPAGGTLGGGAGLGRLPASACGWPAPSRAGAPSAPPHTPTLPGEGSRQTLLLPCLSLGPPLLTLPSGLRRRGRALGGPSPLLTSVTQTWEASWRPTPPLWRWRENHPRGRHNCARPPLRPGLSTGQGPASLPEPRGRRGLCDRVSEDVLLAPGPRRGSVTVAWTWAATRSWSGARSLLVVPWSPSWARRPVGTGWL